MVVEDPQKEPKVVRIPLKSPNGSLGQLHDHQFVDLRFDLREHGKGVLETAAANFRWPRLLHRESCCGVGLGFHLPVFPLFRNPDTVFCRQV